MRANISFEPRANILLVESDADSAASISMALYNHSVRIVLATSAREATDLLQDAIFINAGFDGLLVSYRLPDASGCRVVHDFRHELPLSPIALLTEGRDISVSAWSRARAISVLSKPIKNEDLQQWLHRLRLPTQCLNR